LKNDGLMLKNLVKVCDNSVFVCC